MKTTAIAMLVMSCCILACGEEDDVKPEPNTPVARTPFTTDDAKLSPRDAFAVRGGVLIWESAEDSFKQGRFDQLSTQPPARELRTADGVLDFRITNDSLDIRPFTLRCDGAYGPVVNRVMMTLKLPDAPAWADRLSLIEECERRNDNDDVVLVEIGTTPRGNPTFRSVTTWTSPEDAADTIRLYTRSEEIYP